MTDYKIFNTLFRTAIALFLIGALFTVPLLAAAAECSFLSAEFHAAATEAADRFEDELRLELAKNIRLPTLPQVSSVASTAVVATLSAKFHAAATEAADRFHDELTLELVNSIQLPMLPQVSSVVATAVAATGPMDDLVQKNQPMSSETENISRRNDT